MKNSREKSTVIRLMKYLKPHALLVVLAFVCAIVSAASQLFAPVIIGEAVNCAVGVKSVDFKTMTIYVIVLAAIIAAVLIFQWLMNLCIQRAAHLTVRDARRDGFAALIDAPLKVVDGAAHGDLSARLSVDADQIADGVVQGATQIFTGVVTVIGTFVLMIRINVWIAIAVAALTPLSLLVSFFVAKFSHKYFTEQTRVRGELFNCGDEAVGNHTLFAAYGYADRAEQEFGKTNAALNTCGFKATFYSSLVNPSTRLINSLVYAVAAIMGALFAIDGKMNVGDITTLLLFANQFARPLNEITGVITEFQTSLAAAKRILDLTEVEPQDDSGKTVELAGNIKLDDMSFSYDPEKPLIQNLDLDVPRGTMVAIVGRTGCGKTTLINLLMRVYDPDGGAITFDGENANDLTRS
ncbi:MAG: ABC transporter ATP-binding protein, partial [Clostridiales bacterium]|nr:ABC transporter ATP-binding protein [Clostridiales bacterium]